jgi:hypothetical protein
MTGVMRVEGFCINGDGPYFLGICHSLALWGGSVVDREGKTVAMVRPAGGWLCEDGGGVLVDELHVTSRAPISVTGGDVDGRHWRKATTRREAKGLRLTYNHILRDSKSGEAMAEFDGSVWRLPDADTELVILN